MRLSQKLGGDTCSVFLAPPCGRILKPVCLLSILKCTGLRALIQPLFCFPKGGAKAQVCGLSVACRCRLAFCTCSLRRLPDLALTATIRSTRGLATVCYTECCGCPWVSWEIHEQSVPSGLRTGSVMQSATQLVDLHPLMPSESHMCYSPSLFLPTPNSRSS